MSKRRVISIVRARFHLVVLGTLISVLGFSCTQSESLVVSTTEHDRVTKVVEKWSESQSLVRLDCGTWDFQSVIPGTCFKKGEPDRIPEFAIHAQSAQNSGSVTISLSFFPGRTPDADGLLESLRLELAEAFGAPNVKHDR